MFTKLVQKMRHRQYLCVQPYLPSSRGRN